MNTVKKLVPYVGILVSICLIVCGFISLSGGFFDVSYVNTPGYDNDYGYATFGSDWNTYSNNNMAYAAYAASTTSRNVINLMETVGVVGGVVMLMAGLLSACYFALKLEASPVEIIRGIAGTRATVQEAAPTTEAAEAVVQEVAAEAAPVEATEAAQEEAAE